jgi:hypothetical protein
VKAITEEQCAHSFSASSISATNQRLGKSLAQFCGAPICRNRLSNALPHTNPAPISRRGGSAHIHSKSKLWNRRNPNSPDLRDCLRFAGREKRANSADLAKAAVGFKDLTGIVTDTAAYARGQSAVPVRKLCREYEGRGDRNAILAAPSRTLTHCKSTPGDQTFARGFPG